MVHMLLLERVEGILESGGFDYCECSGCFDIAASRNFTLFLKVLDNVDSFHEAQANNLKIISGNLDAAVGVVGTHTRRERLMDDVVYDRFGIPAFTPDTLESIVVNDAAPTVCRFRGGLFAEIDAAKLRDRRNESGLTQSELARAAGVTKKNIYEHERQNKRASVGTVERIENTLGKVTNPAQLKKIYAFDRNKPRDAFEAAVCGDLKKIGFDTDMVYQTPFNIVARERKILIMTKADNNMKKIEKTAPAMGRISSVINVPAVAVTKEEADVGIPSIPEKALKAMRSPRDMKKFIK